MRVKIEVEFDVEPCDEDGADAFCEQTSKYAAEYAAFHHLAITENGVRVTEEVECNIEGYGRYVVRLPE